MYVRECVNVSRSKLKYKTLIIGLHSTRRLQDYKIYSVTTCNLPPSSAVHRIPSITAHTLLVHIHIKSHTHSLPHTHREHSSASIQITILI